MKVEYNRMACTGWFQCVQEWDVFKMNMGEGKAELEGGMETDDSVFTMEVPADAEDKAKAAAESCPTDAIIIYDDEGNQLVP
jgi:ferredoxin